MKLSQFRNWIKKIRDTEEEEISCTDCFDLVSAYVDEELSGKPMDDKWKQVKQHINQCLVCREEYELLRDIVSNEDSNEK